MRTPPRPPPHPLIYWTVHHPCFKPIKLSRNSQLESELCDYPNWGWIKVHFLITSLFQMFVIMLIFNTLLRFDKLFLELFAIKIWAKIKQNQFEWNKTKFSVKLVRSDGSGVSSFKTSLINMFQTFLNKNKEWLSFWGT